MLKFQQIISKLTEFWAEQGCVIQQGYDIEVGAGTFNPATFLRCLGPEPFQTVYVEPSRRPQDGRFGDNPNRLQLFHQLQVIAKPSPSNIQEMYLKSLESIGFNLREHDIRFVHDDWESPTLGAWGLGWEVWLDGMEVTQFTYFQSVAGFALKPISVELTYGLERLSMILQKADNFFDMQWNETFTYRDIFHRNEVEWSHYNFYQASTEMWLRHFKDFETEAKTLVKLNLPIPAYDFVMKASHAFNMLEARGVLSVTERMGYITRVRELAKLTATEYLRSREKLGFPLLKPIKSQKTKKKLPELPQTFNPKEHEDFLLEIGSEELPATFVPIGCRSLKNALIKVLTTFKLSYDSLAVFGTPRRLAILVSGLAQGSKDKKESRKGPSVSTAFDENGKITKQGLGFFNSLGIDPPSALQKLQKEKKDTFYIQTIKGHDYLMADIKKKGMSTLEILQENLPKLIADLNFPKKMRWGEIDTAYARPLHWIVALHGSHVIPFDIASIRSGNQSHGHAQLYPKAFEVKNASDYVSLLLRFNVMVDIEQRRQSILGQLSEIEKESQTHILKKNNVLNQVLFLSEWPQLTYAAFDENFLKIPEEVLISEMVEHQKYFPLGDQQGKLTNLFVITADNTPNAIIKTGNQNVLSARLADGAFLYEQDLKTTLDAFSEKLNQVIFQKDLGTIAEKRDRLKHLIVILAQTLKIPKEENAVRAAYLCKADLTTELVQEFPDLQGTIGKYYATHQKEDPEVALAIEEHWLPKSEGSDLPATDIGALLSLADKLDNLLGYFSVGLKPTSSSDPYALRRQTIGIMKILIENCWSLNLTQVLQEAYTLFHSPRHKSELIETILIYFTNRAKGVLEDYGFKKDEIEASLRGKCTDPYDQYLKTQALHLFRQTDSFAPLYEVYKRTKGQIEKQKLNQKLSLALLEEPAEKTLHNSLKEIELPLKTAAKKKDYQVAFRELSRLQQPLDHLFAQVRILTDDPQIQSNRIALLQEVFSHFSLLIDFGKIQIL